MRHLALAALTFLLAACGFRPLHQAVAPVGLDSPLRSVAVSTAVGDDSDDKRVAYRLAESLKERLGDPGEDARYRLSVSPSVRRAGLATGRNDVASRFDLNIATRYTLTDAVSGEQLARDLVYSTATFGAPVDPYGRLTAEIDAAEQGADAAADRIVADLAVLFADMP